MCLRGGESRIHLVFWWKSHLWLSRQPCFSGEGAARGSSGASPLLTPDSQHLLHKGLLFRHGNCTPRGGLLWEGADAVLTCRHPRMLGAAVRLPGASPCSCKHPRPSESLPAGRQYVLSVTSPPGAADCRGLPWCCCVTARLGDGQPALTLPAAGIALPAASPPWERGSASALNRACAER